MLRLLSGKNCTRCQAEKDYKDDKDYASLVNGHVWASGKHGTEPFRSDCKPCIPPAEVMDAPQAPYSGGSTEAARRAGLADNPDRDRES